MRRLFGFIILLVLAGQLSFAAQQSTNGLSGFRTKIFYFEGSGMGSWMRTPLQVGHDFCRRKGFDGANRVATSAVSRTESLGQDRVRIFIKYVQCGNGNALSPRAQKSLHNYTRNKSSLKKAKHAPWTSLQSEETPNQSAGAGTLGTEEGDLSQGLQ